MGYKYTIGNLIDQLTVTNLKIWMLEDIKRDPNASDKEIADATRKTNILNVQRNMLIEEIDEAMGDVAKGIVVKSFKQGTTKIYGRIKSKK